MYIYIYIYLRVETLKSEQNEMDPANIVEDTEQTRLHPQTDGQMDRRTDGWTR